MSGSLFIEQQDTSVIAEDIYPAKASEGLLYHELDLLFVGYICWKKACVSAGFANRFLGAQPALSVDLGNYNSCAFRGEPAGDCPTNSRARAGNNSDLPFESHVSPL